MTEMVDMEKLARAWRNIQAARAATKKAAEAEDERLKGLQQVINATLLSAMNNLNADKLGTGAGTIKRTKKTFVNGKDWGAIYRWIQDTGRFDLLHKRLSSAVVEEWEKEHDGALPPGIDVFRQYEISVVKQGSKELPTDE